MTNTARNKKSFPLSENLTEKVLQWACSYEYCTYFNPNQIKEYPFASFKNFIAVATNNAICFNGVNDFELLDNYLKRNQDWLIGHLAYDLKNQIEKLNSNHESTVDFGLGCFFVPDHLIFFEGNKMIIASYENPSDIYNQIIAFKKTTDPDNYHFDHIALQTTREQYVKTASKLIDHIYEGDIYEINYCIEYCINELRINPILFYQDLCKTSPTPFSVFYKIGSKYALGASPERYLKKSGDQLISQPIKGTAKRGASESEDVDIINKLRNNEKERAENMMIVDLVRNDLSRSAITGSVKVEEMFGIYSFKHWHQMISTVSANMRPGISEAEVIKNAFPMGSMTGAPKVKVMELIEHYENFKRNLYSGAIGYFTPEGDFDFNVVIRTLFYDQKTKKGSFMVGSAITSDADPGQEFEECQLKAKPIIETLNKLCKNQQENY